MSIRPIPKGARHISVDFHDHEALQRSLKGEYFDAVVDWIAFLPQQIESDIDFFRGHTDQFVFISSASAYQTPPALLPVTESTILEILLGILPQQDCL